MQSKHISYPKNIKLKKSALEIELNDLPQKMNFRPHILENITDLYDAHKIESVIGNITKHNNPPIFERLENSFNINRIRNTTIQIPHTEKKEAPPS